MSRRILLTVVTLAATVALCVGASTATAAPGMLVGIYDEGQTIFGEPEKTMPVFKALRTQVLRVNLYWGGRGGVANRKPVRATDPADPAYDWSIYDRTIGEATRHRIRILLAIYGTPAWANGGKPRNRAPRRGIDLSNFAFAAARRYSGTYVTEEGVKLPAVRLWLAWNEPNAPTFLYPQFRRVGKRYVVQSPRDYVRICNAIYAGVHATRLRGQKVGCGVTNPRGNNAGRSPRPSISPLVFAKNLKRFGLRRFDAYAHHPYAGIGEKPASKPKAKTAVILGNIDVLIKQVTRQWGPKRIWLTEYGYQTYPDRLFGVSYAKQALYLRQAFAIARKHPRIDMMLWFLLRDEPRLGGWQSGFFSASGRRKPAYTAFQRLPR